MENEQPIIINYGILTSISWNSNNWADEPEVNDLKKSKYDYVVDNGHMHESLNFGHEIYPSEEDGYYIGYTPMFNRLPDVENSKDVQIVFFISSDYSNDNAKSIIGFYGFPEIDSWFPRTAKHNLYKKYDGGNIKAHKDDIIYFKSPVIISNRNVILENLLPTDKKISQQGFNYLNSDNVYNLLVLALKRNPNNKKLKKFVSKFPLMIELKKEELDLLDFIDVIGDTTADNVDDIETLEDKMKNKSPELKQRISSYIERGSIAQKVKRMTNFKCLVCEALNMNPHSFTKSNGDKYIETHHVEQVSTLKKGVLGIDNLITVCANHHRQLHYGNSTLIESTENHFKFSIDSQTIKVNKIKILD
ncbi:hypothetical protein OX283_012625 [Flavobacterium sp. SUN052]|uniref:HNH endonuclease n=1 Tax=Flavobacterium sp. SUN052 TaxID=3002441 RepID=UPI00237E174E|nr:hypothetical protein [Flavobacterium sp. SUN052]MEC4005507.1 hypothetical protein [Flavobacterium sp. SUN052]